MFVSLASLTTNATARREYGGDGREYLVAPVTMIVPGVLPGSKGALYYPPDEVARNVAAWDGTPLTVGHPHVAGQPVSATHASVRHIGRVRVPAIRNGNLRGEAWFDVAALRYESPALLQRLERGERIEVSTGLYTTNEPAPAGASHNGRGYDYVARNYRPDHLAVLPDEQGACSLRDGCGVNNQATTDDQFARQFARVAAFLNLNQKRETAMNSLSDRERRDVMPTVNDVPDGIDHLFFVGRTDVPEASAESAPVTPAPVLTGNALSACERRDVMPTQTL